MQMDNAWAVGLRNTGTVTVTKPNWAEKIKSWVDSKSPTHTWALLTRLVYGTANDAKIFYTSAVDGKNSARGLDNVGVTDYKERVGAGVNTLSGIMILIIGEEVNAIMKLPQGLSRGSFSEMSSYLKQSVGEISNDIVVQGSRASGTAKATSDIDIAIKVGAERFDELITKAFGNPNAGSARWRTMEHAIKTGEITTGDAGLRGVEKNLQELLDMKVDLSIIKKGGAFDNGAQIPIKK